MSELKEVLSVLSWGTLKDVHPQDMGSQVLRALLEETKVPVDKISEVIVGNILSAGLGQGIARQISVKSRYS